MIKETKDKKNLYKHFSKDVFQFAYHIGDLDDFFFPDCTWFALYDGKILEEVILLYSGLSIPTVLVFGSPIKMPLLIHGIIQHLPNRFYCHYQKEFEPYFKERYRINTLGTHLKMKYTESISNLAISETSNYILFKEEDKNEIIEFYEEAYPDGYFEPYMLLTGKYYGIKINNEIKSVAGVHVYSEKNRIAVLGNIATHPSMRGKGLAKSCIIKLLHSFKGKIDHIGLNVKEINYPAVRLYQNLGFEIHSSYEEGFFEKN
ncbi:MAG: GNAT family N-acetyltransferase [Candidatus Hodarchaeota archaeon]